MRMIFFAEKYYYTRDHEGSVREMLNSGGAIVARYGYDAYGAPLPGYSTNLISGTNLATFQYALMYAHQPSGLNLPDLRGGYDSYLGKFIQRDLIQERGGINLYEYCGNDSINHIDPLGLYTTMKIWMRPGGLSTNGNIDIYAESSCCKHIEFIQLTTKFFGNTVN